MLSLIQPSVLLASPSYFLSFLSFSSLSSSPSSRRKPLLLSPLLLHPLLLLFPRLFQCPNQFQDIEKSRMDRHYLQSLHPLRIQLHPHPRSPHLHTLFLLLLPLSFLGTYNFRPLVLFFQCSKPQKQQMGIARF